MNVRSQDQRHVLGSEALITIIVPSNHPYQPLLSELWGMVSDFEGRFSRFLPDSELSMFNQRAGEAVIISPAFKKLLLAAIRMQKQTNQLCTPFVLPALQRAGYLGSWPNTTTLGNSTDLRSRMQPIDQAVIEVKDETARIPAACALDFGGIGKGYMLDQLATYLDESNVTNYWLSLGGDMVCSGYDVDQKPWSIGVQSATEPTTLIKSISLDDGLKRAVATSGVTKRKGTKAGRNWHHIIDSRSGEPAKTDILTATVVAARGIQADAYAKSIVILGSQAVNELSQFKNLERVIIQSVDNIVYDHNIEETIVR